MKETSVDDKIENEGSNQQLTLNQSTTFPQIHTNLNGMVREFVRTMYQDKRKLLVLEQTEMESFITMVKHLKQFLSKEFAQQLWLGKLWKIKQVIYGLELLMDSLNTTVKSLQHIQKKMACKMMKFGAYH
ncbi:MAG: hypothetical protein IPH42_10920 [Bacteroidetes bacterium]|nr:hypothetical protein [Bacteroidota bacterium]